MSLLLPLLLLRVFKAASTAHGASSEGRATPSESELVRMPALVLAMEGAQRTRSARSSGGGVVAALALLVKEKA